MSRPAPAWQSVTALAAFELRLAARRGENLLVTVVLPGAVLLFFSSVPVLAVPGRPVDFLLPGALALGVIATSFVNLGIASAYERHYGVLKRLGGAPLPAGAVVVAKILAVLAIEAMQAVLLVAMALILLSWRPAADAQLGVAATAVALGTIAFAGLGLALAGALRAETTLAVANGLFLVFLLLGGIVLPVGHLPEPLAAVAAVLPAAALSEAFRAALGSPAADAGHALPVLVAWAVAGALAAARLFRSE